MTELLGRLRRRSWMSALLALVALAAACNFGGPGGSARAGLAYNEADPEYPIIEPLPETIQPNQEFVVRLEMNELTHADEVIVRYELDVGGRSFFEVSDYTYDVPRSPWQVVAIPLAITQSGDWNLALIVNSRKVTDVPVKVRR